MHVIMEPVIIALLASEMQLINTYIDEHYPDLSVRLFYLIYSTIYRYEYGYPMFFFETVLQGPYLVKVAHNECGNISLRLVLPKVIRTAVGQDLMLKIQIAIYQIDSIRRRLEGELEAKSTR